MTISSIVEGLRTYVMTCPSLATGALLLVDHLGETPIEYAIIPQAGEIVAERYIDGSSLREYPFLIRSTESTADDLARIETSGFYETLAGWLETQTITGILPTLPTGKTAESVEATSWGYLYEEGNSATGIYQISCKLTYSQAAYHLNKSGGSQGFSIYSIAGKL